MTTSEHCPESRQTSSQAASHASRSVPQLEEETTRQICGDGCYTQSEDVIRFGLSLRTFLGSGLTGSTRYVTTLRHSATLSGRLKLTLRYLKGNGLETESSGWPTPTAKANHDAPSMRKWPAYRKYQDAVKRTTPELWEWMQGYPIGWTDLEHSATQSSPKSSSSSDEQS